MHPTTPSFGFGGDWPLKPSTGGLRSTFARSLFFVLTVPLSRYCLKVEGDAEELEDGFSSATRPRDMQLRSRERLQQRTPKVSRRTSSYSEIDRPGRAKQADTAVQPHSYSVSIFKRLSPQDLAFEVERLAALPPEHVLEEPRPLLGRLCSRLRRLRVCCRVAMYGTWCLAKQVCSKSFGVGLS